MVLGSHPPRLPDGYVCLELGVLAHTLVALASRPYERDTGGDDNVDAEVFCGESFPGQPRVLDVQRIRHAVGRRRTCAESSGYEGPEPQVTREHPDFLQDAFRKTGTRVRAHPHT